jgi:hypothetical protein
MVAANYNLLISRQPVEAFLPITHHLTILEFRKNRHPHVTFFLVSLADPSLALSMLTTGQGITMILHLEWTRRFRLRDATRQGMIYSLPLDKLPDKPGIYIFGRQFGQSFEALYVGKADRIQRRAKTQLNNRRLMQHLKTAKIGKRSFLAGVFRPKPGQQPGKCLSLIERAYIRYFLSEAHELVNKQGIKLKRHEIESSGRHPKRFFPNMIYLEK